MIIKFKNKMVMSLKKMIDDGMRMGGLPSHIEVSPQEALDIFTEINVLSPPPQGYTITQKDGTSARLLLNAKSISQADMQMYIQNWKANEWKVEYNKISIFIVNPTPQTVHLHG